MNPYVEALGKLSLADYAAIKARESGMQRVFLPYHRAVCELLERWAFRMLPDGKRNLALCLPPRHSKTLSVREMLEWHFGVFPDSLFMYVSYGVELAAEQSRLVRDTLESGWYREMFPDVRLVKAREDKLVTTLGGQLYSVGLSGATTGFGAGILREAPGGGIVIDDPLKAADAHSPARRKAVIETYNGAIKSRKNADDTPIVLIMQRLHEEDLVGYVGKCEAGEWHIHAVRAYDERTGTTVWPERFSARSAELLREYDEVTFYAQYQQSPVVPGGDIIKRDWWRRYDRAGEKESGTFRQWKLFITADTAAKTADANDYSVFQLWCATPSRLYLVEGAAGKWEFPQLLREARRFYALALGYQPDGNIEMLIEDKSSGTPLVQMLLDAGLPAVAWNAADYEFEAADKVSRMKYAALPIYAGCVYLPENDSYAALLVDEAAAFTHAMTHAHDDNCDAMTAAVGFWKWLGGETGTLLEIAVGIAAVVFFPRRRAGPVFAGRAERLLRKPPGAWRGGAEDDLQPLSRPRYS